VNISAAARTADPTLNNSRTFDLQVTQSGGEKWNVSVLQFSLASSGGLSGNFYTPAGHSNIRSNSVIAGSENLQYDTAFSTPQWGLLNDASHIDILGNSDYPNNAGAGTTPTVGPGSISVAWGDHQGTSVPAADGTYTVARLTVTGNTGAFLNGYSASNLNANDKQVFSNVYLPISGDVNLDGLANQLDLNAVIGKFGTSGTYVQGDANEDGLINQLDLNLVIGNFGRGIGAPPGASLGSLVPEPASAFIMLGGLGLAFRRRSRR